MSNKEWYLSGEKQKVLLVFVLCWLVLGSETLTIRVRAIECCLEEEEEKLEIKMGSSKTSSDVSDSSSSQTEMENHISASPYAEGEKVLAFHTEFLYEAKVFFHSRLFFLYRFHLNLNQCFWFCRFSKLSTSINDGDSFFIIL